MIDEKTAEIDAIQGYSIEDSSNHYESYRDYPWLIFTINDQHFALNCRYITTIQKRPAEITLTIDMPNYVSGLITVRDDVISLIDIKKLFGMNSNQVDESQQKILVIQVNEKGSAFLIDDVSSVEDLEIVSTAKTSSSIEKSRYLYGVGTRKNDDGLILLLDDLALVEAASIQ